jgi:hypothetical protein
MAVNESRSMNGDLTMGITDGSVKKLAPNRGGDTRDFMLTKNVFANLATDLYDPSFGDYDVEYRYPGEDSIRSTPVQPKKSLVPASFMKDVASRATKLKS